MTERLSLRRPVPADTSEVYAYQRLDEVAAYLYRPPLTEERVRENLEEAAHTSFAAAGDKLLLVVERRDEPGIVGEVLLRWSSDAARQAEIGYIFSPRFAGNGYATEATRAALRLGFEVVGFHRIFARLDEQNTASLRVCERLGMRREARLVESDVRGDEWGTELVYAMLDREWHGETDPLP